MTNDEMKKYYSKRVSRYKKLVYTCVIAWCAVVIIIFIWFKLCDKYYNLDEYNTIFSYVFMVLEIVLAIMAIVFDKQYKGYLNAANAVYRGISVDEYNANQARERAELEKQKEIKRQRELEEYKARRRKEEQYLKSITCPNCHADYTHCKKISDLNRALSIELLGPASSKIGKQMVCDVCRYKW